MASGSINNSDLLGLNNYVQATMLRFPKDMVVSSLRDLFSKDSLYHAAIDPFGFAQVVDLTDLSPTDGLDNSLTTRIFIGEEFKSEQMYYPCVLVRSGGIRNQPISMNRDRFVVEYAEAVLSDGYNSKIISRPDKFVSSGAFDGTLQIQIMAESIRSRDEITEICFLHFMDTNWDNYYKSGISFKPDASISGSNTSDYRNRRLFQNELTINFRSEWRREISINDFIGMINICLELVNLNNPNATSDPAFDIHEQITLENTLQNV